MSVTKRQGSRNSFGSNLPLLQPLYDSACESWQFTADEEIVCGAGDDCQFRLNHKGIADRHCTWTLRSGTLSIRRLNGRIWLNEIPVSSEAILAAGDIVSIGPVTVQIEETARISAFSPVSPAGPGASVATNHSQSAASSTSQSTQPIISPSATSLPFVFAPARPVAPPPLPQSFLEDQSAKISAAAESLIRHRVGELENREHVLRAREQQLQELELLLRDRERICSDRQSILDERAQVLGDQKGLLEEQRAQAEASRARLHQQKLDLELRIGQQHEREDELASQLELSAQSYAQNERTRSELSVRLKDIQQRESQGDQHRRELEDLASWISSQKSDLQASLAAVEHRTIELNSQEAALREAVADLSRRQEALISSETSLREREANVSMAEQRVAEASLQVSAAESKSIEVAKKLSEVELLKATAEEKLIEADHQIHAANEQRRLIEQRYCELERTRGEFEAWQQKSQAQQILNRQLEEQLCVRAAAVDELSAQLAKAQQELELQRQEFLLQQMALTERAGLLDQRAQQIDQRNAELSARSALLAEDSTGGTRSVEELMAIAAERESAIRLRQETTRATDELNAAKAAFADKESSLNIRCLEIENRSAELADRVQKLKAQRNAVREKEQELNQRQSQNPAILSAVHEEHQRLLERQAALMEREARATERENAANVVLRNAEAEREALQMSHKDLICERNALMQFSQDLNSRAGGLTERESIVSQQTEELRSRFLAMNQQHSELQSLENELNQRGADLHRRVIQLKAELRDQKRVAALDAVAGVSEDEIQSNDVNRIDPEREQELSETLHVHESRLHEVQMERDALLTAVRELQRAMLDAREDVEEANRLRTEVAKQEQTFATLYQTIEERSGQLQLMESRLRQSETQADELEQQLKFYRTGGTENLECVSGTAVNLGDGRTDSGLETELIQQLEALKAELKSAGERSSLNEDATFPAQKQDHIIEELRQRNEALEARISQLTEMTDDEDAPVSMIQVDELQAQLIRAKEVISDRDDLIRELRMRLSKQNDLAGGESRTESIDTAELQKEARELDRRASLLDAREEEVRERLRKVANSEDEVEKQRRQLLDARQQLELARTEIQMALKQHSAVTTFGGASETGVRHEKEEIALGAAHRPGAAIFGMEAEPVNTLLDESEQTSASAALDLRAELASLFGLSGSSTDRSAPVLTEENADTSEPLGSSRPVALHFGEDASAIVAGHVEESTPESAASTSGDDSSDDFVRDYMEQLLSRSRKAAGNSLPSELAGGSKPRSSGPSPSASATKKSEATATKAPPRVKSYIDEYMAGGSMPSENIDSNDSNNTETSATELHAPDTVIVPRVKVDVEKLRQNMDSFRSVSTHSVEKALVTHALRTERLSINGRIFLVGVMGFMSVFLGVANYKGVINYPALIWITLLGAIVAGFELTRKVCAIKSKGKALVRCEESCAGKGAGGHKVDALDKTRSAVPLTPVAAEPPLLPSTPPPVPDSDTSMNPATHVLTSPYAAIAAVSAMQGLSPVPVEEDLRHLTNDHEKDGYREL